VLGLGRLGARQLTADSDLDLVLVYDFDPADRTSAGPKPLDAAVAYNRLAQRIVAALTVPTRRGHLYEVDLRLRPGGGQGPVAVQWRSFRSYHAEDAELWEHMALTRARVIAGDAGLGAELDAEIRAIVARPRDPAEVRRAVREMRHLVEREKGHRGPLDLKLAPGGLLDLDFLAQALVLGEAHRRPDRIGLSACAVFAKAADDGDLARPEAERLVEAYRQFDDVLHWQRLMVEGDPAEASPVALSRLAVAMGSPDSNRLVAGLDEARTEIRALFERLMAG
jgi:glutamate-ammonia-ligase adenylyltransferase